MAPQLRNWTSRDVIITTLVVVAVALAFWLAYQAVYALALLFIALALANAMRTAMARLQRWGFSRKLAAMTAHLIVLALLVAVGLLALPQLVDQTVGLLEALPEGYESFRLRLLESSSHALQAVGQVLPIQPWADLLDGSKTRDSESVPALSQLVFPGLAVVFALLATFLLSFHWCIGGETTTESLLWLVPLGRREAVADVFDDIQQKLGAFVRGQLILCVAVGAMAYVAYLWIGVPFPAALALLAGVFEAVPVIGPIVGTIPAVIVGASEGWEMALWVVVANIIIAHIESYVLVPGVMNRAVGVHPMVSIAAIVAMFALLGPIGGVLAIPSAAVIQTLLNRLVFRRAPHIDSSSHDDRGPAAVLRYRAQELLHDLRKLAVDQPVGDDADDRDDRALSSDEILLKSELVVDDVLEYLRKQSDEAAATDRSSKVTGASHPAPTRVARVAVLAGATLAVLAVLWALRSAVALLIMAIVLSWTLRPLEARLPSRRLVRIAGISAMYLLLVVIPAVAGYFVIPMIAENMEQAVRQVTKLHQELPRQWAQGTKLQQIAANRIAQLDGTLADEPADHTVALVDWAVDWGGALFRISISVLFVLFLAAYWSIDGDRFRRLWLSLLSGWRRRQAHPCMARGRVGGWRLSPAGIPAQPAGWNSRRRRVGHARVSVCDGTCTADHGGVACTLAGRGSGADFHMGGRRHQLPVGHTGRGTSAGDHRQHRSRHGPCLAHHLSAPAHPSKDTRPFPLDLGDGGVAGRVTGVVGPGPGTASGCCQRSRLPIAATHPIVRRKVPIRRPCRRPISSGRTLRENQRERLGGRRTHPDRHSAGRRTPESV
jgi:predicted PurR-regulated permease PerM